MEDTEANGHSYLASIYTNWNLTLAQSTVLVTTSVHAHNVLRHVRVNIHRRQAEGGMGGGGEGGKPMVRINYGVLLWSCMPSLSVCPFMIIMVYTISMLLFWKGNLVLSSTHLSLSFPLSLSPTLPTLLSLLPFISLLLSPPSLVPPLSFSFSLGWTTLYCDLRLHTQKLGRYPAIAQLEGLVIIQLAALHECYHFLNQLLEVLL